MSRNPTRHALAWALVMHGSFVASGCFEPPPNPAGGDAGTALGYRPNQADAGTAYPTPGYDAGSGYASDGGTYRADGGTYTGGGYGSGPSDPNALLWSRHGGSPLWDFCVGKPDSTPVPADPRAMVQPGVSNGRAVAFNSFWKDCHTNPALVGEPGHPATCGELRQRFDEGTMLMTPSAAGGGALFSGTEPDSLPSGFGIATFPAHKYNELWKVWGGFLTRPDNFDELVSQRYGAGFGDTPNPYPLPGEDPNATNGGSGRLPVFFTQIRKASGEWTGRIGISCHGCHSGVAGTPADGPGLGVTVGSGSGLADYNLFLRDMLPLGYPASAATLINLNRTRGLNNASDVNLANFFPDQKLYDLKTFLGLLTSGSTAEMNTPAWWNMGHRVTKFADGMFPIDAPRADLVFYSPFFGIFGGVLGDVAEQGQDWMRAHGDAVNIWAQALHSPEYPMPIDVPLAEEGAVLFHTLNLWDPSLHNPVRSPGVGNGSCASCHGAYAPRYFNDPNFLASPALEGVASYITPLDIIGTDPVRVNTNNDAMNEAGALNFFGYPETMGTDNDCGPQNQPRLRGNRPYGYLAPPLYGVWASAPYFHNGSVPNLWEVLKPSDRRPIWRRVSTPARSDQAGRVVMGYDTDLGRAFDTVRVGWRYEEIPCQTRSLLNPNVVPYVNCNPTNEDADPLVQNFLDVLYGNLVAMWNFLYPPILTRSQMEDRKIFNSHVFSHDNHGHEFNSVLTDHQRRAIIEYLKTL
ncbi:MAG: hypothetical protein U0230_17670 [Polyangiales bacterium]